MMNTIACVIWLLGWPIVWTICDAIEAKYAKHEPDARDDQDMAVVFVLIWIGVAALIWSAG